MGKNTTKKTDFYDNNSVFLNYHYVIEIDGIECVGFKEMSEFYSETEVEEYREGGLNGYVHKFAKHNEFSTIELKHGLGIDNTLYDWRQQVIDGNMKDAKRSGSIKFYNLGENNGNISRIWQFTGAWPFKLEISASDATSSGEIVIESISLAVERIERI